MKFKNWLFILMVSLFTSSFAMADIYYSDFANFDAQDSSLNGGNGSNNGGNGGTGGTGGTTGGGTTGGGTTGGGTTGGGTTNGGTGTTGGTGSTGGTTGGGGQNCVRTQGYWGSSPAGQARLIVLVGPGMQLGNMVYTAAQLDDILDAPTGGNALRALAKQLIAAKLNILNGADGSEVMDDIAAADALIGNLSPLTDSVANNSALGQQMNEVKDTLDDYNNGLLNVDRCR